MLQVLLVGVAPDVKADPIPGLFNTGVGAGGTSLANGATELHYALASSPYTSTPTPLVRTSAGGFPIPPWIPDSSVSAWTVPNFDVAGRGLLNHLPGIYKWKLSFDLTGLVASTASITGKWAADNGLGSTILLNGLDTVNPASGFKGFTPFTISSGFQSGTNTLAFIVVNGSGATGNPTGLRVEMDGTAAPVPEPTTALLMGIGIVGLIGGAARKKFKKKAVVKS